jgi:hypothetical protein
MPLSPNRRIAVVVALFDLAALGVSGLVARKIQSWDTDDFLLFEIHGLVRFGLICLGIWFVRRSARECWNLWRSSATDQHTS